MKYLLLALALSLYTLLLPAQNFEKLAVGQKAQDFSLQSIANRTIQLSSLNDNTPVVLIVLRGWPEYQCPVCSRQVGQFIEEAKRFHETGANILMVYPGPANVIQEKAKEFSHDLIFPEHFYFVLDPDYSMINQYGLRWDAQKETAYPSTFVINKKGEIVYSKISSTHGGRATVEEIVAALNQL